VLAVAEMLLPAAMFSCLYSHVRADLLEIFGKTGVVGKLCFAAELLFSFPSCETKNSFEHVRLHGANDFKMVSLDIMQAFQCKGFI